MKIPILPIREQQRFSTLMVEIEALRRSDANLAQAGSSLESSLSAHAFSGQLTKDWREAHKGRLALEARDRDVALKEAGAPVTRSRRATIPEEESGSVRRTDGIRAELSGELRGLLDAIGRMVRGEKQGWYFTAEQLATHISDGPLRGKPQTIEGHFVVLAARGLIIPVSREEQTEDTGEFVFGNAYRLPRRDKDALLVDEKGNRILAGAGVGIVLEREIGDHARLRELERLAAQLEKERALT